MSCVFGPYKISCTSLSRISETEFLDENKNRRIAIIENCNSSILSPCDGSVALHESNLCPESNCQIRWYECPTMGRTYTLIVTPCGIKITSFENGLTKTPECASDEFGSSFFCFGKIYTEIGEFPGITNLSSFEFDGNAFKIEGTEGECGDIFDCTECGINSDDENNNEQVTQFQSIPSPIPDSDTTKNPIDEQNDTSEDSGVKTEIISSENRTIWHNTPPNDAGPSTICNDELNVTSWAGYPTFSSEDAACISNNNPSVVSLPSGHSIISYEQRLFNGLTKIGLAILPSSVNKNIRYYRKLSRGTLINNPEASQITFEIYEELGLDIGVNGNPIGQDLNLAIGFLSGPIAGPKTSSSPFLYTITNAVRTLGSNGVTKYVLNFAFSGAIEFPDGNNIYDVMWFLVNDAGDGALPPGSANIITSLELEPHLFNNIEVPLSSPSIAVAKNNLMSGGEQNIYLVYQAFEENQWRVYLRQIVLGADEDEAPTYLPPYLFDPDQVPGQRTVTTFGSEIVTTFDTATTIVFEDNFDGVTNGPTPLEDAGEWEHVIPQFEENTFGIPYDEFQSPIILCRQTFENIDDGIFCPNVQKTCRGYVGNFGENFIDFSNPDSPGCNGCCGNPPIPNSINFLEKLIRTIYINKTSTTKPNGEGSNSVTLKMTINLDVVHDSNADPPLYVFYVGRDSPTLSDLHPMSEGWRIYFGWWDGESCSTGGSNVDFGFTVRLYNGENLIGPNWDDVSPQTGSINNDRAVRVSGDCLQGQNTGFNQFVNVPGFQRFIIPATPRNPRYFNEKRKWEFELKTWKRGTSRVFVLSHLVEDLVEGSGLLELDGTPKPNTTNLKYRMWQTTVEDVSTFNSTTGQSDLSVSLGKYHGMGFYGSRVDTLHNFKIETSADDTLDHIFYEDFFCYDRDLLLFDTLEFFTDLSTTTRFLSSVMSEPNSFPGFASTFIRPRIVDRDHLYGISNSFDDSRLIFGKQTCRSVIRFNRDSSSMGTTGYWGVLKLKIPAQDKTQSIPFDVYNTSFIAGIPKIHGENSQCNIWFLLRQPQVDSDWHSGWRVRVMKWLEPTTGLSKWTLSLYDGNSSTGDNSDIPIQTVTKTITGGLDTSLDWENLGNVNPFNRDNYDSHDEFQVYSLMQYFRIDTEEINGNTQITILLGTTKETQPIDICQELLNQECPDVRKQTPDEVQYEVLHAFIPVVSNHLGTYYGIAAFGDTFIPEASLGAASIDIDSISLQRLGGAGEPPPPPPTGSCCFQDGSPCQDITQSQCLGNNPNNIWDAGTTCNTGNTVDCSIPFPSGASCRDIDGFCAVSTEAFVPGGFNSWQLGTNCILGDNNYRGCTAVLGTCCRPFLGCLDGASAISHGGCEAFWGNSFQEQLWSNIGDEGTCGTMPCLFVQPAKGACCLPSFSGCEIILLSECDALGGTFKGSGTDCTDCTGACCNTNGTSCTDTFLFDCLSNFSTPFYSGNETLCSQTTCLEPQGACCFDDGQCGTMSLASCQQFIYTSWTQGQNCNPNPCPEQSGACCDPITGSCSIVTISQCASQGGVFSSGTCTENLCIQPTGACCINNICSQLTENDCINQGGTFFGDNMQCLPDHCSLQDPYSSRITNYKPEDLWTIETGDNNLVTRVLYNMQEESIFSSINADDIGSSSNAVDFMFVVDVSGSMEDEIGNVSSAISTLSNSLSGNGFDVKFGLVLYARSINVNPIPDNSAAALCCDSIHVLNALHGSSTCAVGGPPNGIPISEGGFTRSASDVQNAINCWGVQPGGAASAWAAIQFAINNNGISWRDNSDKFLFIITDTRPTECVESNCINLSDNSVILDNKNDAINALLSNGIKFIPSVCTTEDNESNLCEQGGGEAFLDISETTGWNGPFFRVNSSNYNLVFESISSHISTSFRKKTATVVERSESGVDPTFIKPAELLITYDGDLSDLWTFNKSDFEFTESHAPLQFNKNKGLTRMPFDLASGQTYGIPSVHIQGQPDKWVSLGSKGHILYDFPNIGRRKTSVSSPVLLSKNSTKPKVFVNNRNQVIVAYENYSSGSSQIQISGSGDFHQNSITGPKSNRITRFLTPSDFSFFHAITIGGDGVNQLCDFVIDNSDIIHIVWQSNIDKEWEIYYANSYNMFDPVRITKSNSRSSLPSIDIDTSGSIFVVYHDNRFGPFEIMLANKDEGRVIPLLEQDAYLASLRNKYNHYVNTLPVVLDNPNEIVKKSTGQFWGTKTLKGPGNDNENYIYKISSQSGSPSGGISPSINIDYIAWSKSQELYGVRLIDLDPPNTSQGNSLIATLYRLATASDSDEIIFDVPEKEIGEIDLNIQTDSGMTKGYFSDMNFDNLGRLWVLIDSPGINSFEGVFKSISITDAKTVLSSGPIVGGQLPASFNILGGDQSAFTIDAINNFYLTARANSGIDTIWSDTFFRRSSYPSVIDNIAQFNFTNISNINIDNNIDEFSVRSMATDHNNNLFIATNDNDLYSINRHTGNVTFQSSLTTDSTLASEAFPIGFTSGISFQNIDTTKTLDKSDFFHVIIEFFDNISLEGDPFLTIDSRNNLEAFISEPEDPYLDPYEPKAGKMDSRGIFIPQGVTGIVFFDASQFSPGFPNLSQPYGFEPNQTYFPKVFSVNSSQIITPSIIQNSSFSCSKCSRLGDNNFNSSGCSYSFVIKNDDGKNAFYNFEVFFYADSDKKHILRKFNLLYNHEDLSLVEVNNLSATSEWSTNGLKIDLGGSSLIQIYPALDTNSGFLCGINYAVSVKQCINGINEEICTDFSEIELSDWSSIVVEAPEGISNNIFLGEQENLSERVNKITVGMRMRQINGVLTIAYRTSNDNLAYVTYNGKNWTFELIDPEFIDRSVIYCDLGIDNGKPAVIFTMDNNTKIRSRILDNGNWIDGEIVKDFPSFNECSVPSIFNNTDRMLVVLKQLRYEFMFVFGEKDPNATDNVSYSEIFGEDYWCLGQFQEAILASNGIPYVVFFAKNKLFIARRQNGRDLPAINESWVSTQVSDGFVFSLVFNKCQSDLIGLGDPEAREEAGKPAVVNLSNGNLGIAYIQQNGAREASFVDSQPNKRELIYKEFNILTQSFTQIDTNVGQGRWAKNVAMTIINGNPHIAYMEEMTDGTFNIKIAIFNGSRFNTESVATGVTTINLVSSFDIYPAIDIIEFENKPAILVAANPLKVYVPRNENSVDINKISSTFFCDCSSKAFAKGQVALSEIGRWESSAHGFSDTRVTDSFENSLNPSIKTRISGSAIILWEDYNKSSNCLNPPCIRSATFRDINQDQLHSSGSKSWFDYDLGAQGTKPNLDLDVYDRSISGFERLNSANSQGFYGHGVSQKELPTSEIINKVCDFTESSIGQSSSMPSGVKCDLDSLESNIVTFDKFISSKIVKKAKIRSDFVQYYTYNAGGQLTAIVSTCQLVLEIHGVPEIVAIRIKNENETEFGDWCPWSPKIGDFMMEKIHKISALSGIKKICLQAMTYSGITSQFCIPVVADYSPVVFETRFYKSVITGDEFIALSNTEDSDGVKEFSSVDTSLENLPLSEGVSVANLSPDEESGSPIEIMILFEVIPNSTTDTSNPLINFDVLQQGNRDMLSLTATRGKNNDGQVVYRGFFTIKKEDNLNNIDGLARISPHFPDTCQTEGEVSITGINYEPDSFNKIAKPEEVVVLTNADQLDQFRQEISGKIGVNIDVRSLEDPYFIFGDPNYNLQKLDEKRDGVVKGKSSDSIINIPDSGGGTPGGA